MTFWRTFHSVNEDLAFIFGFSLNILLLIVIKKIKVKALQKYNVLLLQCCCVDMLQVISSFIVKPILIFHRRTEYLLSNGFLRPIGGPIEMLGIVLWIVSLFFCITSIPLPFVFRYRILCLKAKISKKFYVISLIVSLLNSCIFGIIVWKFHYLDNRDKIYLAEENLGWLMADDEGKVKAASVSPMESICLCATIASTVFMSSVSYSIIIICYTKIINYFKYNQHCLSITSKKVQRDLNRMLMAQAIIPIFFAFLPVTIHVLGTITDFDLVFASFICGILYCWIPVGNAISVLFFVTAYRTKFKQLFLRVKPKLPHFTSVSPTVGTDTQLQLSVANTNM